MVRIQWPRETGESNLTLEAAKRRSVFTGTRELTPPGRNAPNGKAAGLRGWAKVTTGQTQFYLFNWLIFQTASLSTEGHKILRNFPKTKALTAFLNSETRVWVTGPPFSTRS